MRSLARLFGYDEFRALCSRKRAAEPTYHHTNRRPRGLLYRGGRPSFAHLCVMHAASSHSDDVRKVQFARFDAGFNGMAITWALVKCASTPRRAFAAGARGCGWAVCLRGRILVVRLEFAGHSTPVRCRSHERRHAPRVLGPRIVRSPPGWERARRYMLLRGISSGVPIAKTSIPSDEVADR